jgi:hypothetical protein
MSMGTADFPLSRYGGDATVGYEYVLKGNMSTILDVLGA